MIKIIDGDILESKADIIAHQVNCQGVMSSGVAKAIRNKYPFVFNKYKEYIQKNTPEGSFGTSQLIPIKNMQKYIANLFGQFNYGYDGDCYTNIEKLHSAMISLNEFAEKHNCSICFPYKIGCVRGGADWDIVYRMICDIFKNVYVEIRRLDRG